MLFHDWILPIDDTEALPHHFILPISLVNIALPPPPTWIILTTPIRALIIQQLQRLRLALVIIKQRQLLCRSGKVQSRLCGLEGCAAEGVAVAIEGCGVDAGLGVAAGTACVGVEDDVCA